MESRFKLFAGEAALVLLLGRGLGLAHGASCCVGRLLTCALLSLIHQQSVTWRPLRDHVSLSHMLSVSLAVTWSLNFPLNPLYHSFVVDLKARVPLLLEGVSASWQVLGSRKLIVSLNKNLN